MDLDKDADQPGYQASYDPADHRDVGTGADFGADLYELYRAGRVEFPLLALRFVGWTTTVHDFQQRIAYLDDSVGGQFALRAAERIRDELHAALHTTAQVMEEVGIALVSIASDFASTDERAHDEFNRLVRQHPDQLGDVTPSVPDAPGPRDPFALPYTGPALARPAPDLPAPLDELPRLLGWSA